MAASKPSQIDLFGDWIITKQKRKKINMLRVGFEPTPFRTRTLIWRLRPTRPSQLLGFRIETILFNVKHILFSGKQIKLRCTSGYSLRDVMSVCAPRMPPLYLTSLQLQQRSHTCTAPHHVTVGCLPSPNQSLDVAYAIPRTVQYYPSPHTKHDTIILE